MSIDHDFDCCAQPAPTANQMKFIDELRTAWQVTEDELARLTGRKARVPAWKDPASIEEASAMINKGKDARNVIRAELREARQGATVTEGLWMIGTVDHWEAIEVFKVQAAVNGSGQFYAKRLVGDSWEYEGRAPLARIAQCGHMMTAEEAAWFGQSVDSPLYGRCVNCARPLTDETSIGHGYGKICASKRGWPY